MKIAAIILAAGSASRMGRPKQLLLWRGEPLVRAVARRTLAAPFDATIAVVGAYADDVRAALAGLALQIVVAERHAAGQSESLRAGVAALPADADAAAIVLADQPFIDVAAIAALCAAHRCGAAAITAPRFAGQRGHPVIFARALFAELLAVTGDAGARQVIASDPRRVQLVDFADDRPLVDIDTPEDYARLSDERTGRSDP